MTCTLLGMGFTFVATVAAVGFLGWLGMRRLVVHLKGNPEGTRSFVENVLVPLFGPKAGAMSDSDDARGEGSDHE
jgi:hypothetical protein